MGKLEQPILLRRGMSTPELCCWSTWSWMVPGPKLTQNKEIVPFLKAVAALKKVQRILALWTVPAQLPVAMSWLLLRGGRCFPCPWRMELGETSHGCPVEETTFLPDLEILNNSHDSRSWVLLQPLHVTRLMLSGLAKVCIAL